LAASSPPQCGESAGSIGRRGRLRAERTCRKTDSASNTPSLDKGTSEATPMSAAEGLPPNLAENRDDTCCDVTHSALPSPLVRDAPWHRAARWARRLSWASVAWMLAEGVVGLWQGMIVGSIALTGWALGSAVEGLASLIVIWRFTGSRTMSETAERRAQRGVAVSFWLLAPYIAAESIHHLLTEWRAATTVIGMVLTAVSLLAMPILGRAKHELATRLGSAATAGEGTQNYLCAVQAAAVLIGLAVTGAWPAGWWLDPIIGLAIAGVAVWEGIQSWRGKECAC
jgi:Cation efflux family